MVPYHSFGKFYQIAVHFVNGILPDWKAWDIKPWTGDRRFVKECWKEIAKISAVPDCFSGSVLAKLFSPSFTMWLLIHEHISKEWPWRPFKQRLVVARNSEARSKEPFGWTEHDGMSGHRVVSRVVGCSRWFLPLMLRKCTSDTPHFFPWFPVKMFPSNPLNLASAFACEVWMDIAATLPQRGAMMQWEKCDDITKQTEKNMHWIGIGLDIRRWVRNFEGVAKSQKAHRGSYFGTCVSASAMKFQRDETATWQGCRMVNSWAWSWYP